LLRLSGKTALVTGAQQGIGAAIVRTFGAAPLKWSTHRDSIIPSEEDQKMAGKRDKPEEIVAKLRQVEVLQGQGQSIADAVRQIGVTQQTYYR
jgi:NAD(P)-dependent dehydrogenase (short-subunit alcohol dehydrogenase family)